MCSLMFFVKFQVSAGIMSIPQILYDFIFWKEKNTFLTAQGIDP